MRQSNRTRILDAAVGVVRREGLAGVTFESVAVEAGITKGGLLYHFRTRDELLLNIYRHLARQWEERLLATLGKDFEASTAAERAAAYVKVLEPEVTRGDLLLLLESSTRPEFAGVWNEVIARWTPTAADAAADEATRALFIARLAVDGLWLYESLEGTLPEDFRKSLMDQIQHVFVPSPEGTRAGTRTVRSTT